MLYSRPGCQLCEELEDALHENFAGRFELVWRDVDRDRVTRAKFGHMIPVLTGEQGELLCQSRLNIEAVAEWLDAPDSRHSV